MTARPVEDLEYFGRDCVRNRAAGSSEVIVGYDLLECADLDETIEVARAHPMARRGRLELRPLVDLDG
ncbi:MULTISPECIES: YciI family protein [Streptosporangium]|uniref:YCII-related domain-containing protein n=1 Tax=Streptosporangium brasiliense TaxID=47480 RepID=A0ABT9RJV5_9ACTN|nr:YciI family protein [Streptosporangium brasiliense]MDP9869583.1 hypothetical protein [Streptosporangium brasiliense]